jgi:hypothetical protein
VLAVGWVLPSLGSLEWEPLERALCPFDNHRDALGDGVSGVGCDGLVGSNVTCAERNCGASRYSRRA